MLIHPKYFTTIVNQTTSIHHVNNNLQHSNSRTPTTHEPNLHSTFKACSTPVTQTFELHNKTATTASAQDITKQGTAANHHANTTTSAINVISQDTQASTVYPTPVHHSDLKPSNPLPRTITNNYVNIKTFKELLDTHPNKTLVNNTVIGFKLGFDIGYKGHITNTNPTNLLSPRENKGKVTEAIAKELSRGHTSGPFTQPPFLVTHCSPIGARIKNDNTCRLIVDLSQPRGNSINEFINS